MYSKNELGKEIQSLERQIKVKRDEHRILKEKLGKLQKIAAGRPIVDLDQDLALEIENTEENVEKTRNEINDLKVQLNRLKQISEEAVYEEKLALSDSFPVAQRVSYDIIVLTLLFTILLFGSLLADILLYPRFQRPLTQSVVIDSKYHHLGDNNYDQTYVSQIPGDRIRNLNTEGLIYTAKFDIVEIRNQASVGESVAIKKAEVSMNVNHLKSRSTAPVGLGLNGELVAYLNNYVTREEFKRTLIRVLLDVPLSPGENELVIVVGKDTEENAGEVDAYEDFEFDNLQLHLEFDTTRVPWLSWFGLIVVVELIILTVVLSLLIRRAQRGR